MSYEYKVVPAPTRGLKAKGIKTAEARFAHALETTMNDLAVEGWEYQRTDTLPSEQREGFMSKTTVYQNMLVFRRALVSDVFEEGGAPAPAETQDAALVVTNPAPLKAEPQIKAPKPVADTPKEPPVLSKPTSVEKTEGSSLGADNKVAAE